MKKLLFFIALSGFILGGLQSCQKIDNEPLKSQVLTIHLKVNESFTFTLPATEDDDEQFRVIGQANHFSQSSIVKSGSGEQVYKYTPALDYSGTDTVVLSNESDSNSNNGGNNHCGDGDDELATITINFTMKAASDSGN
jgi:hypothetical protein